MEKPNPNDVPDVPEAWFLLLVRAIEDGRLADAARCIERLAILGIDVKWRLRPKKAGGKP